MPTCSASGQAGQPTKRPRAPSPAGGSKTPRLYSPSSPPSPPPAAPAVVQRPGLAAVLADPEWQAFSADPLLPGLALELARFLALKVEGQDWDDTYYAPSDCVGAAWRQLLLRPQLYLRVCGTLGCPSGTVLDHDADATGGSPERQARYQAMLGAYRLMYGPPMHVAWGVESSPLCPHPRALTEEAAAPSCTSSMPLTTVMPFAEADSAPGDTLSVRVVDAKGSYVSFNVRWSTRLGKLKESCCQARGLDRRHVHFHFDGQSIADERTPDDYDMWDDAVIKVDSLRWPCTLKSNQ